ncbi:unnamed protein product [Bursaphelenchus xylophilus]|uniref:(pine wood nematode) hypothetical protein n=1 Tax=Bursaphelenchus xylophilus TaxID=6326 RepID=A0A1I7SLL2_BURXY|nr:unnamed protein product [Bursaphelenchus xylophilus]CAG9129660.1 unnamed protein product [Bursaphelenchus xylophilus]
MGADSNLCADKCEEEDGAPHCGFKSRDECILSWNVAIITISDLHLATGSRSNTTQIREETQYFQKAGLKVFYEPIQQGVLYAAPLVGGLLFTYPVQWCLRNYNSRPVYSTVTLASIIATASHPLILEENFWLVVSIRLVQGLVFSLLFPTIALFMTYWSTLAENSVFMSIFMGVPQLSGLLSIPLSSYFVKHYGWPLVFYAHAGISTFFWLMWTVNYKENTVFRKSNMARSKLNFSGLTYRLRQSTTWAVLIASAANSMLVIFAVQFLQLFLMSAHGIRMQNAGVIVGGVIAAQKITFMPLSWQIRMFNSLAFFGPAALLVWEATGLKSDEARLLTIVLVFILGGFNAGGFMKSPAFVQQGTWLIGAVHIVNVVVCIILSVIIPNIAPNGTFEEFHVVFMIVAVSLVAGNILFCLLSHINSNSHASSVLTISTIAP